MIFKEMGKVEEEVRLPAAAPARYSVIIIKRWGI